MKYLSTTTGKQREAIDKKLTAVRLYQDSGLRTEDFIAEFNAEHPDGAISYHQLMRWQNRLNKNNQNPASLADNRGCAKRGTTTIPPEAWEYFWGLYAQESKPPATRCYEFTKAKFPDIPRIEAFKRKLAKVPEYAMIRWRDGEKAYRDKLPSMLRSRIGLASNAIWFSDHHKIDVLVLDERGKLVRPWLTAFFDARSNRVVSHIVRTDDPDAVVIKRCLRLGIENNHAIPGKLYFDNGKDYREKSFSKDFPLSLVNQLGIDTIYATPYHGQTKTIERFFGTLETRFGKFWETYIGRNAQNRPERTKKPDSKLVRIAPGIADFRQYLAAYIDEYNATRSRGIDMDGQTPNEVYEKNLAEQTGIVDEITLKLLCGTFDERTVQPNGIKYINNWYEAEALLPYIGKKVIISCDDSDISVLHVFTPEHAAICSASAKIVTPFGAATVDDYKRAKRRVRIANKLTREYEPTRSKGVLQELASDKLERRQFGERSDKNPEPPPKNKVFSNLTALNAAPDNTDNPQTDDKPKKSAGVLLKIMEYQQAQ
ncbi:MAG: Mu transposase C-terminal domain-containing protein, partial [Clostridiales bacterium]|nr:Mu transposase C-terminal domain-containing protein [Clostridiales bacterium]